MEVGNIVYSHIVQKGYVKAAGQEVYREDYPLLYQFALENELLLGEEDWANGRQGMYSVGDEHGTFRVPDLRGQFLRALDDGVGEDAGRLLGSKQGDAIRNITGHLTSNGGAAFAGGTGAIYLTDKGTNIAPGKIDNAFYDDFYFDASKQVPTAAENLPKNIALITQIKY